MQLRHAKFSIVRRQLLSATRKRGNLAQKPAAQNRA
jgi:hypothetical protein